MKHDELCPLSQPCDPEEPSHGYCGFSAPLFCIQCHTWCTCAELGKKREQAIRDCIAAVNAVPDALDSSAEWERDYDVDQTGQTRNPRIWVREAIAAIEALGVER